MIDDVSVVGLNPNDALVHGWLAVLLSEVSIWRRVRQQAEKMNTVPSSMIQLGFDRPGIMRPLKPPVDRLKPFIDQLDNRDSYEQNVVYRNARMLGTAMSLPETSIRLITFIAHMQQVGVLKSLCRHISDTETELIYDVLSHSLGCSNHSIQAALTRQSGLRMIGILEPVSDLTFTDNITEVFRLEPRLLAALVDPCITRQDLLSIFFTIEPRGCLSREDLTISATDLDIMIKLLQPEYGAMPEGTNILLHGKPGCGKTELARYLASTLGLPLMSVANHDPDNIRLERGLARIQSLEACWRAARCGPASIILIDEAEDILCDVGFDLFGVNMREMVTKGRVTSIIENTKIPTIWITNTLRGMDPALLRRFKYVVEVKNGDIHVRQKRIRRQIPADHSLTEELLNQLANCEAVTPALVRNAVDVADTCEGHGGNWHEAFESTIQSHITAGGKKREFQAARRKSHQWRADAINADIDIERVIDSVRHHGDARLCLYGMPGTGKTYWATELAQRLDKPLVKRQAADLLSPYVGETERLIASAFEEAADLDGVLLIDEADSFLDSRASAKHSWETTRTNQFLTSMESHPGLFIATTNVIDRLDPAVMRRFDFRVRFKTLLPEQAGALLQSLSVRLGLIAPDETLNRAVLHSIDNLTAGDFAALERRLRLERAPVSVDELVGRLREDTLYKQPTSRAIGFLQ